MDYFIILEDILLTKLPKEKFIKFDKFYKLFLENKLIFDHNYRALEIENPSYADFLSFVIVPAMFIYFAIFDGKESFYNMALIAFVFIYYVISGLRRLIQFNINANEGEVEKYFTGIPTPLGAILLWVVYLIYLTDYVNEYFVLGSIIIIGYLLNSKIKIKHL